MCDSICIVYQYALYWLYFPCWTLKIVSPLGVVPGYNTTNSTRPPRPTPYSLKEGVGVYSPRQNRWRICQQTVFTNLTAGSHTTYFTITLIHIIILIYITPYNLTNHSVLSRSHDTYRPITAQIQHHMTHLVVLYHISHNDSYRVTHFIYTVAQF